MLQVLIDEDDEEFLGSESEDAWAEAAEPVVDIPDGTNDNLYARRAVEEYLTCLLERLGNEFKMQVNE